MKNYFGRTVNQVVIPELSEQTILASVAKAEQEFKDLEMAKRSTAVDFYYNENIEKHIEQFFSSESLQQIPTYPQKVVPRFARARMMLYKNAPKRMIGGEMNEDYNSIAYMLDSQTKQFSELSWLLGSCHFKTKFNERKQRLEYEILPFVKEYYLQGESEPYGYSYEIDKGANKSRQFVFWSEEREGMQGMHFRFDQKGKRFAIAGNPEMINPYKINRTLNPNKHFTQLLNDKEFVKSIRDPELKKTFISLQKEYERMLGIPGADMYRASDENSKMAADFYSNAVLSKQLMEAFQRAGYDSIEFNVAREPVNPQERATKITETIEKETVPLVPSAEQKSMFN